MPRYTKESLETLRQKIDLVDLLSSHLQLKKAGGSYKACCPFHDEKSPSFVVKRGDTHYHCFGCGAHGDAIQFLIQHVKMSFSDAVAHLAERFCVQLEQSSSHDTAQGPNKARLKELLAAAQGFFHAYLFRSEEGVPFLTYLMERKISPAFIQTFQIGLSPSGNGMLRSYLREKGFSDQEMQEAGIVVQRGSQVREFFQERLMFPIQDQVGACIGFSARKIRESVYGSKYINTPETVLFKKSRILFGLNFSRRRIAKERHAIIVEGQLDALRLIFAGFDYTVAALGTAFGEAHARELERLGVNRVYLLFDGDKAGRAAAIKVGHLFQHIGIEVMVATLQPGADPDALYVEKGPLAVAQALLASKEYLPFYIDELSKTYNMQSPADKQKMVDEIRQRVKEWGSSVMVHESLKKAARILNLPEDLILLEVGNATPLVRKTAGSIKQVDPRLILEADLLRWLILCSDSHPEFLSLAQKNLADVDFKDPLTQELYRQLAQAQLQDKRAFDLIEYALTKGEEGLQDLVSLILNKKINRERAKDLFVSTIQKLKERNWMHEREEIKVKIHSGMASEAEVLDLVRKFDQLKKNPPQVIV